MDLPGQQVIDPETSEIVPGDGFGNPQVQAPELTKRERFVKLANRRTGRALKDLASLIPLTNRQKYEFYPEDAEQIMSSLADALMDLKRAFDGVPRPKIEFRLK